MAQSIKELKKENMFLKGKCEKSDVTLIELVEEVWITCISMLHFSELFPINNECFGLNLQTHPTLQCFYCHARMNFAVISVIFPPVKHPYKV